MASQAVEINFINDLQDFCEYTNDVKIDSGRIIFLTVNQELYSECLLETDLNQFNKSSFHVLSEVEEKVKNWMRLIEKELVECQLLRRETEVVGPSAEVTHWKKILIKSSSICDQIRTSEVQIHLKYLISSKSKLYKAWKTVEDKVAAVEILAKDNTKYLYQLKKFMDPIYRLQPAIFIQYIPSLMYALQMVYTVSRFFNNKEMITTIFVKITNQLILSCKIYLTDNFKTSIRHSRNADLIKKMKDCIKLNEHYYQNYLYMKKKFEFEPAYDTIEISEVHVFGKFNSFKERLQKLIDIFEISAKYRILYSSTMDGIDVYAQKFNSFYQKVINQNYDPLDFRTTDFDTDYIEFKQNVADAEMSLRKFFYESVAKLPSSQQMLSMIKRFQKLDLKQLSIDKKYLESCAKFELELEEVRDRYNQDRSSPNIPRNIPMISGRILWINQLTKRIEIPMRLYKNRCKVISHEKMQKCIRTYNAILAVFVYYEFLYHKAWYDSAIAVKIALATPLLIKNKITNQYSLNFDPYITEIIRESEKILKLGLDVPDIIKIIIFNKYEIYKNISKLKFLVNRNDQLRKSIPSLFLTLLKPCLFELNAGFQSCTSLISWTSLEIDDVCERINNTIKNTEIFIKKIIDMKEARIDGIFHSISETQMIQSPKHPSYPQEFSKNITEYISKSALELSIKSSTAEQAVLEIINEFIEWKSDSIAHKTNDKKKMSSRIDSSVSLNEKLVNDEFEEGFEYRQSKVGHLYNACMELFTFFNQKFLDSLVRCTKNTLELLKMRVGSSSILFKNTITMDSEILLMQTDFVLDVPNIRIVPRVEVLQNHFNLVLNKLLEVHKSIDKWGHLKINVATQDNKGEKFSNYYEFIINHKEIVRILMSLQGSMLVLKDDIAQIGKIYQCYSHLWAVDKISSTENFIQSQPFLYEIKEKFLMYEALFKEINGLPNFHLVGCLRINMGNLKEGLLLIARSWMKTLGERLSNKYKDVLKSISEYVLSKNKVLIRDIEDLEDVRIAMNCLAGIRQDFISLDQELHFTEEIYMTMIKFEVKVSKEEQDIVDSLRYNFSNMLQVSKEVQKKVFEKQDPLKKELIEGLLSLEREISTFDKSFEIKGPLVEGIPAKEASDRVLLFNAWLDDLVEKYEKYSSGETLFGLEVTEYPTLNFRKKQLNLLQKLYGLYLQVMRSLDGYYKTPWIEIDTDIIISELIDFQNKCRRLPKALKEWPAYIELKTRIDEFNECCPLLELMATKAMKERHWKKISELCNYKFDVENESFTVASVMKASLLENKDEIEDICITAMKEKEIESKLKQIVADWSIVNLSFSIFKQRGELLLKGNETAEIIGQLEDSMMVTSSLLANRYNTHLKKDIQLWQNKLNSTSEILSKWLNVQNLWIYLEAVFIGGDISRQLPTEAKRFSAIDKAWIKLMYRAREKFNAVEVCTGDETMKRTLPFLLEQLELCQKSLSGYLETKRVIFPRFCFISDPSLLEILGQAADSHTINKYLDGLFDNVDKLEFSEREYDMILAMFSRENEKVIFETPVLCVGGVENWLNTLLQIHRQSLNTYISQGFSILAEPDTDILQLIDDSILQVGLLAVQVTWTQKSELALSVARKDKSVMKKTNKLFLDLLNQLIDVTIQDLTKYSRQKFESLITIHVHQRDIFDDLCHSKVRNLLDFEWLKQARFYYDEEMENISIKITDVNFLYQNEFLGCTDRLVITPLTDRCYITLAQSIGMNFGGAPAGPAGTGKTETTKDMGKALGKYVVVFNCSDQMDFRGLGRIFKGLAQSGSWGCFDEFNRIDLPVLSVAAQQIDIVLTAKKQKNTSFLFSDGEVYNVDFEFGFFITMNPGYAGRQELPENLKMMFRSVAMMVPDRQIIMRVKLAACGFKENILLSRKFFTLYKLCEEQLSKQVHYDFGLRNILSCLRTLGAQKRAYPNDSEGTTLMRVLRDMNLSKLVDEDEPLFFALIENMFPDMKLSIQSYKELQKSISNAATYLGIVNHPDWNLKVIQLYETSLVRHGLMVLGPTGSGKTKCIWTLMKALTELGRPHKEIRMNPKAITASQMFGRLDAATNDWFDGIFSTLWRRSTNIKKTDTMWIVLDGPVDAVWIENLNSVLDDNKTLTLANGDRIVMSPNCKLVFEPDNIDNASPATVSRMGMVFFSASTLSWRPVVQSWLAQETNSISVLLSKMFEKIFNDALEYLQTKLFPKISLSEIMYTKQCIDILQGLLSNRDSSDLLSEILIEKFFLFALMWSLGAALELDGRECLQQFFFNHSSNFDWPKLKAEETIFEFFISESDSWMHWNEKVPVFEYPSDKVLDFYEILVPNVDNTRTLFLIELIAKQEKAVLLIGEQGTAKTVMIKGYMSTHDLEYYVNRSYNFSSASTPNMVQRVFESYVEKRIGNTFGPPNNKKMTVFIDDINMPVINEWGDQVTNEIVRQLMEYKGFYSLDKPGDFLILQDIMLLAAMIHPGGGRNDISPRLKRQFSIFNCTLPSSKSMDTIFRSIGLGYFCATRFSQIIIDFIPKIIPLTRVVWQKTKAKMLPTPTKFHYIFNLRDLSRIWEGILRIESEQCKNIKTLLSLWKHECERVISDRFIDHSDTRWFKFMIHQTAEQLLGSDFKYYDPLETYFVNFLRDVPEPTGDEPDDFVLEAPKTYEEFPGFEVVIEKVKSFIEQFKEYIRGVNMDLVFFHDALMHLIRISRILGSPRGNALLVGVGGSGKQSLTRLASFIANYDFFQIILSRNYNSQNLIEDIRKIYRTAGTGDRGLTFIFTDNEIKEETFLEYINNILSVGEVANLFLKDELDEILLNVVGLMKKSDPKRAPTPDNLYEYFITRARKYLHIVLCFSPVSEKFRSRSLKFPGLISGCTVDWFFQWPKDALSAVSLHFLKDYQITNTNEVKNQSVEVMGDLHASVNATCVDYFNRFHRQSYVTPKSFLIFLSTFKDLYKKSLVNINILSFRMSNGLKKLVDATAQVDELRKILVKNQEEITEKNQQVNAILETVNQKRFEAEAVKTRVLKSKEEAETLLKIIAKDKKMAEKKLLVAEPALLEAEAALQTIKAADIATVRKLSKPPYLITLIMDCVMLLFGKKLDPVRQDLEKKFLQATWSEALKVMSDTKFLWNLQNFPKDNINAETIDLMIPYLNYHGYTYENALIACGNVAGLIQWTMSMVSFYSINRDVLPLKSNLAIQQGKHEKANKKLKAAESLLKEKDDDLKHVQQELNAVLAEQQKVIDLAQICQTKMDTAKAMIEGLSGERSRWTTQLSQFKSESERLVGNSIILTGFLTYAGPFNQEFRSLLQKKWYEFLKKRKIPVSPSVNIIESLSDTATTGEWSTQGLPNDDLSIQNGIIITKAPRFPLIIDPQLQGKTWIIKKEVMQDITLTFLWDKYLRNHLENCISMGKPLMIQDVKEDLDPILDNILEKNFVKVGSILKVNIGEKEVDYDHNFRLYITTKLANPSYPPEIFARTSIIDFAVTSQGLEDQLLSRVMQTEKQELEITRTNLVVDVSANNRKMKELETNLLEKLTSVQGPLIEDLELMNVLNITKQTAAEVNEKLMIAKDTEVKINTAREEFRPVATRGSILYFLICDMAQVNVMYQTSLLQFLERFDSSMKKSAKNPVNSKRIVNIIEYLTYEVFKYKSRGLYKEHKSMFALLIALKIDLNQGQVSYEEFQYFLKGGAALDLNEIDPKPQNCKWITDVVWLNLFALTSIKRFEKIVESVKNNDKVWKNWFDKELPEEETIPDSYHSLSTFQKLLLIRTFCMDRALVQSKKYISSSLGSKFAEPIIAVLELLYLESNEFTPMICFLSMGSDPTLSIEQLAKKTDIMCRTISMGQGQEVHARKVINYAVTNGFWVLCQNCHLGLDYMAELVDFILGLEKPHSNFRLWITTEPHEEFPISLLQISLKFTCEPPQGIKAGLFSTYSSMSQSMLDKCDAPQYIPTVYAISFLHTVVQERRRFGPLGWNVPYEFNSADWLASCLFISNHFNDIDLTLGVSWPTVRYMIGEVQYGGRVTDDYDKRLLNTFCKAWFSDNLFDDVFCFHKSYPVLFSKQIPEYLSKIDGIPAVDSPQVFGLHPNADITYLSNTIQQILDTILLVQPKETSDNGSELREVTVSKVARDMLGKLPIGYDQHDLRDRLKRMGQNAPMNIFLKQEIDRLQRVIELIRFTLKNLLLAIEGIIIMSEQLKDAFDNIYDSRVPQFWKAKSWESTSIGFWFTELVDRNTQFNLWLTHKRPTKYWMTGFFNPQGFLTAMQQEVTRLHRGWALDQVTLQNDVTRYQVDEIKTSPNEGVYVYGLYLEGAGWDRKNNKLCESINKVLYVNMPVIHIYAVCNTLEKNSKLYHCPVYKKLVRTQINFVTPLWLQTDKSSDYWILRGVALLCDVK